MPYDVGKSRTHLTLSHANCTTQLTFTPMSLVACDSSTIVVHFRAAPVRSHQLHVAAVPPSCNCEISLFCFFFTFLSPSLFSPNFTLELTHQSSILLSLCQQIFILSSLYHYFDCLFHRDHLLPLTFFLFFLSQIDRLIISLVTNRGHINPMI